MLRDARLRRRGGMTSRRHGPARGERAGVDIRAAGGVVWRDDGEIAPGAPAPLRRLVAAQGQAGARRACRSPRVREVAEETGPTVHARPAARRRALPRCPRAAKVVRLLVDAAVGAGGFTADAEVDELRWLPPAQAAELLSYAHDLRRAAALRRPRPPHVDGAARAARQGGQRSQWDGDDDLRPLDAAGRAGRRARPRSCRCSGPDRLVTAPPLRCVQTVAPLADAARPADRSTSRCSARRATGDRPRALARAARARRRPRRHRRCAARAT